MAIARHLQSLQPSQLLLRKISDYWSSSGTPTYLINMMRKFNVLPTALGPMDAQSQDFDAPTERMT